MVPIGWFPAGPVALAVLDLFRSVIPDNFNVSDASPREYIRRCFTVTWPRALAADWEVFHCYTVSLSNSG